MGQLEESNTEVT